MAAATKGSRRRGGSRQKSAEAPAPRDSPPVQPEKSMAVPEPAIVVPRNEPAATPAPVVEVPATQVAETVPQQTANPPPPVAAAPAEAVASKPASVIRSKASMTKSLPNMKKRRMAFLFDDADDTATAHPPQEAVTEPRKSDPEPVAAPSHPIPHAATSSTAPTVSVPQKEIEVATPVKAVAEATPEAAPPPSSTAELSGEGIATNGGEAAAQKTPVAECSTGVPPTQARATRITKGKKRKDLKKAATAQRPREPELAVPLASPAVDATPGVSTIAAHEALKTSPSPPTVPEAVPMEPVAVAATPSRTCPPDVASTSKSHESSTISHTTAPQTAPPLADAARAVPLTGASNTPSTPAHTAADAHVAEISLSSAADPHVTDAEYNEAEVMAFYSSAARRNKRIKLGPVSRKQRNKFMTEAAAENTVTKPIKNTVPDRAAERVADGARGTQAHTKISEDAPRHEQALGGNFEVAGTPSGTTARHVAEATAAGLCDDGTTSPRKEVATTAASTKISPTENLAAARPISAEEQEPAAAVKRTLHSAGANAAAAVVSASPSLTAEGSKRDSHHKSTQPVSSHGPVAVPVPEKNENVPLSSDISTAPTGEAAADLVNASPAAPPVGTDSSQVAAKKLATPPKKGQTSKAAAAWAKKYQARAKRVAAIARREAEQEKQAAAAAGAVSPKELNPASHKDGDPTEVTVTGLGAQTENVQSDGSFLKKPKLSFLFDEDTKPLPIEPMGEDATPEKGTRPTAPTSETVGDPLPTAVAEVLETPAAEGRAEKLAQPEAPELNGANVENSTNDCIPKPNCESEVTRAAQARPLKRGKAEKTSAKLSERMKRLRDTAKRRSATYRHSSAANIDNAMEAAEVVREMREEFVTQAQDTEDLDASKALKRASAALADQQHVKRMAATGGVSEEPLVMASKPLTVADALPSTAKQESDPVPSEEALLHRATEAALDFPDCGLCIECFDESKMVITRPSVEAPWDIGLRFDWNRRSLAMGSLPTLPLQDTRRFHPFMKMYESRPVWYLEEVNGTPATKIRDVMNVMKNSLRAQIVFKRM